MPYISKAWFGREVNWKNVTFYVYSCIHNSKYPTHTYIYIYICMAIYILRRGNYLTPYRSWRMLHNKMSKTPLFIHKLEKEPVGISRHLSHYFSVSKQFGIKRQSWCLARLQELTPACLLLWQCIICLILFFPELFPRKLKHNFFLKSHQHD